MPNEGILEILQKCTPKPFLILIILILLLLHHIWGQTLLSLLDFDGKWAIVLALTSNQGGLDFQLLKDEDNEMLYQKVLKKVQTYGYNIMFVVGATRAEALKEIRKIAPDNFLLVPGVVPKGEVLKRLPNME